MKGRLLLLLCMLLSLNAMRAQYLVRQDKLFSRRSYYLIDFSRMSSHQWAYPMKKGRAISPFGGRRRHKGVDIKTHARDTIYASFCGRVSHAGPASGYGRVVVLQHDMGFETLYAHNSKHLVAAGDYVRAGQPIAIVGRTGRASTEHCHFEVHVNGRQCNPADFFDTDHQCLRKVKVLVSQNGKISIKGLKSSPVKRQRRNGR